ncbi:hypothetical protein AJ80_09722 [Polytolypa hystricis UAMH7299]|uniref:PH domain-containing protein n=1 Tax=Polytolypa hystricis (strain UAMH7299) TaxID=1447883 RepID=A0A2B7WCQ9_POLH7|nr:hypothetical protein AJ80_09722 [Polytolypa hystricis UAMH7299]
MAEKAKKGQRRKSISIFGPTGILGSGASSILAPSRRGHDRSVSDSSFGVRQLNLPLDERQRLQKQQQKHARPRSSGSLLLSGKGNNAEDHDTLNLERRRSEIHLPDFLWNTTPDESTHSRSKSYPKSMRKSVLGSLRSLGSHDEDQYSANRGSSGEDEDPLGLWSRFHLGTLVLHHGEVQTTAGMWRKKSQYLVLTDTHLARFKSQAKASEMFPSIPPSWGRSPSSSTANNRLSIASMTSLQDPQLGGAHGEMTSGIPLNNIVAVYKLDDGRPYFSIEVCYIDEKSSKPAALHLQLNDPQESELWLGGIRAAAEKARALEPVLFDNATLEYVARTLEQERDYDPDCFQLYRVVRRASSKSGNKSSSEDLGKIVSTVCYLAIGIHKIHLIPLPKQSNRSSVVSLAELELGMCFGIMTLTSLTMHRIDDSLQMVFRAPFRPSFPVILASTFSAEIAVQIRQQAEFLRPEWVHQPFSFNVPDYVEDRVIPAMNVDEDHRCFDRTLIAYCAAYNVDTSNIRYTIDYACDDAPAFQLLHPANTRQGRKYSALELLAVMRALRYNESFVTISFYEIELDILQNQRDPYGMDYDSMMTRSNIPINIPGQDRLSVLSQEIRALALKSKRLRRMDFTLCITRQPTSSKGVHDPGCGIPEAVFPLCRRQLTNIDWIVLNGIKLGDSDLDYLVDAASQKASHLRALEVSHCGISIHDLDILLSTLTAQENTLEGIDISGVQGRLSPELFQQQIGYFAHIRKINLSHISRTSGPEPLIAPETLMNWRLEELSLSHTAVNEQTVDSIAAYLHSPMSRTLKTLRFDQCGLTGQDVAIFFHSMTDDSNKPRELHLHVSENRLHVDYSMLFDAIAKNKTPTHLTMRMVEFQKEDHFRQLVEVLRKNTTLKYLDISKASLPYDAGQETCKALQRMFEDNTTIEELDISGEYAHLDVARFGIGLNLALTGLKKNTSLRVLKIEHQKLGLQGASTLASVLEVNNSLLEVYCENNEINLQSFTVLVNGLQRNTTLLHLPGMTRDREQSLERVRREIEAVSQDSGEGGRSTASSIRKSVRAAVSSGSSGSGNRLTKAHRSPSLSQHSPTISSPLTTHPPILASSTTPPHFVSPDVQAVLQSLGRKWDVEVQRLQRYLVRNYNLAHGVFEEGYVDGDADAISDGRPATAASLGTFIRQLSFDTAPSDLYEPSPLNSEVQQSNIIDPGPSSQILEIPLTREPSTVGVINVSDTAGIPSETPSFTSPEPALPHSKPLASCPPEISSSHLSVPTPALPRPTLAATGAAGSSIRSFKSNSTSTSTSTSRSGSMTASSSGARASGRFTDTATSLRGLLTARALERRGKNKGGGQAPPRLDWRLPELKFD